MTHELESHYDADLGWLAVTHDGSITWDELQDIKTREMGADVIAVEVYPATGEILNKANVRHLWRVPQGVPMPDLQLATIQGSDWDGWTALNAGH